MEKNFDTAITWVFHDEGGFAIRENEPMGGGNKGVSMLVFTEWRRKQNLPDPTFDDLKNLTDDEAKEIYRSNFANVISFDLLPSGVDYTVLNISVMQGPTGAKRILQESIGHPITGKLDDDDWDFIHKSDPYKLVAGLLLLQAKMKMNDPRVGPWKDSKGKDEKGFGPGWGNRIWRVWNRATGLMEGQ